MTRILPILMIMLCSFHLSANERVKWEQGQEISLELKTNDERKLIFPEKVRFGTKSRYAKQFKHSLIDNMFYVTPKVSFNEKLTFQGLESGRFYVVQAFSLESSAKSKDDLIIHLDEQKRSNNSTGSNGNRVAPQKYPINPIDLVQYAAQSLYAPSSKLIEPTPGIKRVALKQRYIPNLYRGGVFKARTLASWSGGGMYVTALKLTNISSMQVVFEPCRIRGDFYSATAQFKRAMPAGHKKEFTIIYLLSEKPFDVAVKSRELLCV